MVRAKEYFRWCNRSLLINDTYPAKKGVLNILEAASREQSVKRVVVKSSGVFLTVKERPVRAGRKQ